MNLLLGARDLVYESLPAVIRKTLLKSAVIRGTLLAHYGLMRNMGFSFPTILQIFEKASMHIVLAKYLREENIIITCCKAREDKK